MSSPLTLIVLGQAYFLNTLPNVPPFPTNSISDRSTDNELEQFQPEFMRTDYKYTPGIGGHKVHTRAHSWEQARQVCKDEGGDLAVINSVVESEILVELLEKETRESFVDMTECVYIGFFDPRKTRKFITVDGKSLENSGYTMWSKGEPNNWMGKDESCGAMNTNGNLNDSRCDLARGFICELPHV